MEVKVSKLALITGISGQDGSYLGPDELLHDPLAQALHLKNVVLKDKRVKYDEEVIEKLMSNKLKQSECLSTSISFLSSPKADGVWY